MSDYIISCCSTADLSKEHFENRDIKYIYFHYQLDGENYPDDLGQSIPFDEFYKRMAQGAETKTEQHSQISTNSHHFQLQQAEFL